MFKSLCLALNVLFHSPKEYHQSLSFTLQIYEKDSKLASISDKKLREPQALSSFYLNP